MGDNEYNIINWQTELGGSNILNRFQRQDNTGWSIEDIEKDKAYKYRLIELQQRIYLKKYVSEMINADKRDKILKKKDKKKHFQR